MQSTLSKNTHKDKTAVSAFIFVFMWLQNGDYIHTKQKKTAK